MTVEIRDNGRLEIRLTKDGSPVHIAAIETLGAAIEKGKTIRFERFEGGVALVVEG